MRSITILKLGGSLITHKDVPLSVNENALRHLARAIEQSNLPSLARKLILIHGGGSFGHYYAKKFGLSEEPKHIKQIGIAQTSQAMFELHRFVTRALLDYQIGAETILPSELFDHNLSSFTSHGIKHIENAFANNLVPITFGHVGINSGKAFIVSGDTICMAAARSLKVRRVVFAMDVDGIYPDSSLKGSIVRNLSAGHDISTKSRLYDVTGGISAKLELGFQLRRLGVEVFYVNGTKEKRLRNLLMGKNEENATKIV